VWVRHRLIEPRPVSDSIRPGHQVTLQFAPLMVAGLDFSDKSLHLRDT
jgi:hypothetical protein